MLELNARRANTTTAQCSESRSNESHVLAGRPPHSARSHCSLAQRVTCWLVSVLGFSGSRGFLGCPVPLLSSVLGFSDSRGSLGCPVPLRSPHLRARATPPPSMAGACVLGCRSRSCVLLMFSCRTSPVTHGVLLFCILTCRPWRTACSLRPTRPPEPRRAGALLLPLALVVLYDAFEDSLR